MSPIDGGWKRAGHPFPLYLLQIENRLSLSLRILCASDSILVSASHGMGIPMTTRLSPAARKARTAMITSRICFGTGVVVSLAANVVASEHTPLGIALGLWTPLAFLASMALIENVLVEGWKGRARLVAIAFLAAIAAWCSYWHMVDVATMGGADVLTAHTMPLTVDVMMALASPGMKKIKAVVPARRRVAAKKNNVTSINRAKTA